MSRMTRLERRIAYRIGDAWRYSWNLRLTARVLADYLASLSADDLVELAEEHRNAAVAAWRMR